MNERSFDHANKPDKINSNSTATLQRQKGDGSHSPAQSSSIVDQLRSASSETSQPLDNNVSTPLSQRFGYDFSRVKVHSGPASATAAESISARAYTLGNRIHLGNNAHNLDQQKRHHLLAHEAVHTMQQGGQDVSPSASLNISSPNDSAEREAEQIAESFSEQTTSPSLGVRDQLRASMNTQKILRSVSPQIQRDLIDKKTVRDGTFDYNLKTESHAGAKNGMSGTIKFKASETAPDASRISLLQVIRNEDLDTGSEYVWPGAEAGRNDVQTTEDTARGIEPGFHVDRDPTGLSPRTKATDAEISPYYIANYGPSKNNKDGRKLGKTITEASLWDYPGSHGNRQFSFETAAKGTGSGRPYTYATLRWGFTISDASKGKVENEHASVHRSPSATFGAAVTEFNEFYKNPGASTAPAP